ncbi:MAG: hypothetical protein HY288_06420 [Planctomycetia bacterium]|nr:hypothetical protein [Planctomycetia bacterium]
MSHTEKSRDLTADAPPSRSTPAGTRVDTAHLRAGDGALIETPPAKPAESETAEIVQQVRSQAVQLAAHLQRQQSAVDHREAQLNARSAAIENQVRSARLWLTERHADLAERQAEVDRREKEVAKREAELVLQAKPMRKQKTSSPPATEEKEFADRKAELDRRQSELDALAERLAQRLARAEKTQDAEQALRTLEKRRDYLERAEKLFTDEQAELERQRQQFVEERTVFAEQAQADRQKLADEQRRAIGEQDRARHELKRQSDELAARQIVLERMRADVARSQQEALDIRLATEELWARLCGTMAPAALTQSLAQIRLQLAEEHRLTRVELAGQKAEVQALCARLAEQHQKLAQQREDLQTWATDRQKELEKQAGLLVTNQRQIDEERAGFKEKTQAWDNERFRLQQEISRLLRQLNRAEAMVA